MSSITNFIPYYGQLQAFTVAKYNMLWPTKPPDIGTVMQAYTRFPVELSDRWPTMMSILGYGQNAQDWYRKSVTAVMPYSLAATAYLRGYLPLNSKYSLDYFRRQNNIPSDLASTYNSLNMWYPSLNDLDKWYITSAYDDNVAQRYTLDSQINSANINGMGRGLTPYIRLGMTNDFAKYEWRSTWQMPSFYEATYMYNWYLGNKDTPSETNNGAIQFKASDFTYAMQVANWPPFFQQLLLKIASHPPTRIMIEQFYQAGTITEKELPAWFDWSGYHGKINDMLVSYTIATKQPSHKVGIKHSTASLLQRLYVNGKISKETFEKHMTTLGYTPSALALYETYIQLNEQMEYEKVAVEYIHEAYMKAELDDTNTMSALLKVGVMQNIANEDILKWKTMLIKNRKYLTIPDLVDLFSGKIMTGEQVYEYLTSMGYNDIDANRIMTLKGVKV